MVLNKDCVRDVLIYIEKHCVYYEHERFGHSLHEVTLKELTEADELSQYVYDDIHYTLQMLFEGNYIKGRYIPDDPYMFNIAYIKSLTPRGHELLDNIKPEPVWDKTKGVLQKIGNFSLDVMTKIASEAMVVYIKSMMGL